MQNHALHPTTTHPSHSSTLRVILLMNNNQSLKSNIHWLIKTKYRQVSNISHTLVGNNIFDHSDVVGASPVGAAPTTSSLST